VEDIVAQVGVMPHMLCTPIAIAVLEITKIIWLLQVLYEEI
jgi:hypothetical protein